MSLGDTIAKVSNDMRQRRIERDFLDTQIDNLVKMGVMTPEDAEKAKDGSIGSKRGAVSGAMAQVEWQKSQQEKAMNELKIRQMQAGIKDIEAQSRRAQAEQGQVDQFVNNARSAMDFQQTGQQGPMTKGQQSAMDYVQSQAGQNGIMGSSPGSSPLEQTIKAGLPVSRDMIAGKDPMQQADMDYKKALAEQARANAEATRNPERTAGGPPEIYDFGDSAPGYKAVVGQDGRWQLIPPGSDNKRLPANIIAGLGDYYNETRRDDGTVKETAILDPNKERMMVDAGFIKDVGEQVGKSGRGFLGLWSFAQNVLKEQLGETASSVQSDKSQKSQEAEAMARQSGLVFVSPQAAEEAVQQRNLPKGTPVIIAGKLQYVK